MIKTFKVKKQFTFRELMKWIFENDIRDDGFMCKDETRRFIIDKLGNFHFGVSVHGDETYEVVVEEKITEKTELQHALVVYYYDNVYRAFSVDNTSIKEMKLAGNVKSIYIPLEDGQLQLIWERETNG